MSSLKAVVLGLVIVFLDVTTGSGHDLVADPVGWVLVLLGLSGLTGLDGIGSAKVAAWLSLATAVVAWSPASVAHLDASMEWFFSLPTLAFCYLLCDALVDLSRAPLDRRFGVLRTLFAVAAVVPVLIYGADWQWLVLPTAVLLVLGNLVLVVSLWSVSEQPDAEDAVPEDSAG